MRNIIQKYWLLSLLVVATFAIIYFGNHYLSTNSTTAPVPPPQDSPQPHQFGFPPPPQHQNEEISVEFLNSEYETTIEKPTGTFSTGQSADIMLSGFGFNNSGGSLLFNHQGNIATDGKRLILADRNNNRVLIWNSLPDGNEEPDLVLGQTNFTHNNPGTDLDELNWPVGVATDGTRLFVADTYNNRILIWKTFPTENAQPADISIQGEERAHQSNRTNIIWPWAVWSDGEKLAVASTGSATVYIWNTIPTKNNQEADISIHLEAFGTPRTIGSDGTNLIIGDHNAFKKDRGNFFWKSFPTTNNQKYDFYNDKDILWGPTFTEDGKFITVSNMLQIWNQFPEEQNDQPDLSIGNHGEYNFGGAASGDGSGIAYADGKLYISLSNGNRIVGYNKFPTSSQKPDFAIGAPDINTNTLETEFIMSNGIPATNGESLFISSDFDRKLYVWKNLPNESGAPPDYVYNNLEGPWDNALHENTLALGGRKTIYLWEKLPLNGEMPNKTFQDSIGSISFQEIKGIALDSKYLYVADEMAHKVYVWEGIPQKNSEPIFSIDIQRPSRLSSDGKHLVVTSTENSGVYIYDIETLPSSPVKTFNRTFNLPQGAIISDGHLFIASSIFNSVHIWENIEDAIAGKPEDAILGNQSRIPEIGKDKLFWPAGLAFDGNHLWVSEFKFSERVLRFSVK